MTSEALLELIKRAEQLEPEEQLALIAYLAGTSLPASRGARTRRPWSDLLGAAPNLLGGEDAQAWVSRERALWDERERQWRDQP